MPFGPFTLTGNRTFSERRPGSYTLDGLTFADPQSSITVNPGTRSKDRKSVNATITRRTEKVKADGTSVSASVSTTISVPPDGSFTAAEVDTLLSDINEFSTPQSVSRILQGER